MSACQTGVLMVKAFIEGNSTSADSPSWKFVWLLDKNSANQASTICNSNSNWIPGYVALTSSCLFSRRAARPVLATLITVTRCFTCHLTGSDCTSSKKYVANPYSGRSSTILHWSGKFSNPQQCTTHVTDLLIVADIQLAHHVWSLFCSLTDFDISAPHYNSQEQAIKVKPVMFLKHEKKCPQTATPSPLHWPLPPSQWFCLLHPYQIWCKNLC